jgi:hypothetical protein
VTIPAGGRGGSTPPRPAAPRPVAKQRFVFGPWVYDIVAAIRLLRAAPRPPQPLPVLPWACAYGLISDPASEPDTISLIGPGFDPGYAMTTSLDDPVIIATVTLVGGQPAGPLLIDGCHRLYKAAVTGACLPAVVLTAAESLSIRHEITLGPRAVGCPDGDAAMITVTIWHNTAADADGRHTAILDGYQPGDPMVRVFTYQADAAGRPPEAIAEQAYAICNGHPRDAWGADLSRRYYQRELRSLSFPGN